MTLPIDHGVPVPVKTGKAHEIMDTIRTLEPGDSFFADETMFRIMTVRVYISKYVHGEPGKKFATRSEPGGIRVWRIA